jgi:recombination protein RecA
VSRSGEVVDMASDLEIIQKSGAWYSMDGERIGQGRDNARLYLEEHPELMTKIEARIMAHHGFGPKAPAQAGAAPGGDKPSGTPDDGGDEKDAKGKAQKAGPNGAKGAGKPARSARPN